MRAAAVRCGSYALVRDPAQAAERSRVLRPLLRRLGVDGADRAARAAPAEVCAGGDGRGSKARLRGADRRAKRRLRPGCVALRSDAWPPPALPPCGHAIGTKSAQTRASVPGILDREGGG